MTLVNVKEHGWLVVKQTVAARESGRCIATNAAVFGKEIAPDLCRNGMGWTIREDQWRDMELEHVKDSLGMQLKADDSEAFLVLCCGWHHRLSNAWRVDTATHREQVRAWLAKHYPDVWAAFLERRAPFEPSVDGV